MLNIQALLENTINEGMSVKPRVTPEQLNQWSGDLSKAKELGKQAAIAGIKKTPKLNPKITALIAASKFKDVEWFPFTALVHYTDGWSDEKFKK